MGEPIARRPRQRRGVERETRVLELLDGGLLLMDGPSRRAVTKAERRRGKGSAAGGVGWSWSGRLDWCGALGAHAPGGTE